MKRLITALALILVATPFGVYALSSTNRVETSNYLCSGSLVKNLTAAGATFDSISESELPSDYTTSDKYCIRQTKTTQCAGAGGATTYAYALYNTSAQSSYVQPSSCYAPTGLDSNGDPILPKTSPAKVWTNTLRYITPTATLTASPATTTPNTPVLLTWTSNQSSCTGTGFSTNNAASGSVSVTPSATTQYTVTCGSVSASKTVAVTPPVTLTASANSVAQYATTTLTWSSVGATYCSGTNFATGGATAGTVQIFPSATKTYSVECYSLSTASGPGTWEDGGTDISDFFCSGSQTPSVSGGNVCADGVSLNSACTAPGWCQRSTVQQYSGDDTGPFGGGVCYAYTQYYYCQASGAAVSTGTASKTITVTNGNPTTPTFTGSLACPASVEKGVAATFTLSASDPDGDNIHYGMDWDNNASVDEWKPSQSTYVASGVSQTFSHTWNSVGTYTVKGLAEDTGGNRSGWAQCQVTVIDNGPKPPCSDGLDNDGDGLTDIQDPACHSDLTANPPGYNPGTYTPNGSTENLPQCFDGQDNDGNGYTDWNPDPNLSDPGCSDKFDDNESVPTPTISLSGVTLVRAMTPASLTWSATNVKPGSCTLKTEDGSFQWSLSGTSGVQVTNVIAHETTYIFRCLDLSNHATSTKIRIKIAPESGEQ